MTRNKLIRLLCISLVTVTLALALILGVAVIGGAVAEGGIPEESEETPHFRPFFPEGSLDIGDILDSIDPGDFTRDPDDTRPIDPDVTLPEWESDFEWPTLPPTLQTDPDFEWPTLPEGWDTLPEEWGTLPPEWGDLPYDPEDLADLLAGMDGGLDMPPGALAAGVASQLTVMDIYAERTDTLYLKMQSFGAYNGRGWDEAGMYGGAINELGYSANYLPHYLMNEITPFSGYPLTITPKMEVRVIPYYIVASPELDQIQMSDVKAMGAYDQIYTLYYRPYGTHVYASMAGGKLSSFEKDYAEFVERGYLEIDDTTMAYMKLVIEEQGFDPNDPDIVEKVATYIQNAATYNLAYNQNLDREPNVALAFLGAYKEGVCRHYATAATLLYRALGIPARYTVGFMADVTAWETTAVKGADAHAWVEVYEEGFGWRYVEVTGSPASGEPAYPPETGTGTGTAPGTGGDVTEPPTEPIHDPTTWGDLMAGTKGEMIPLSNIPLSTWKSIVFRVTAPYSDRLLLKLKSFGDYTEDGFATVTDQPPAIYGYSSAYLTGLYLLSEGSVREQTLTISSLMNTVAAPYYITPSLTPGGSVNVGDTRVTGTVGKNEILTIPYCNAAPGYASVDNPLLHAEYAAYAKQTFTTVLWDHANSLSDLIAARGWQELSTAEAIPAVVTYLQTNYSLDPDAPATQTGDEVMYFLMQSCKGSHRHFAAAATLIYRMLGIPARYTVGYLAETVAGQEIFVRGTDAYAWVEVYIEGIGWVAVDVAENASEIPEITLKPTDQYFLYDGSTHVHDGTLTGFEAYEALGYTYEATVSGKRSACGATSASIVSVILYDPSGQDVTDRFAITCRQGTVTVYETEIWLESPSATKTYDGLPMTVTEVAVTGGRLPEGYSLKIIPVRDGQRQVGTGYARFDVVILYDDGDGNLTDRTHYFRIHKRYGTHTVTHAPLTIKAADAEKAYDGTPLTADGISVIGGVLAEGDYVDSYTLEGSQTRVGRSENLITEIVIRDRYGNDVTKCYAIETVAGTLKVTAGG